MAELISIAGNYPATEFDTLIPQLTDPANIREAFLAYHFGVENFDGNADVPAADSIHGHIESFKAYLALGNLPKRCINCLSTLDKISR